MNQTKGRLKDQINGRQIMDFTSLHVPLVILGICKTSEVYMHVYSAPLKPMLSSWLLLYCFYSLWEMNS